jgi:hypothetical protein
MKNFRAAEAHIRKHHSELLTGETKVEDLITKVDDDIPEGPEVVHQSYTGRVIPPPQ